METTVTEKQNIFRRVWTWFIQSGERMREEEEEVRNLRLQQLRAEEESIEKYGSVQVPDYGEEAEKDLRFFELLDVIGEWFVSLRRSVWEWMKKGAKDSAALAHIVGAITKRSRQKAKQKAQKMAELAVSGVDEAGESLFEHLPQSWQDAYLKLEDDVVTTLEEKEDAVKAKFVFARSEVRKAALKVHDAGTVAVDKTRSLWETKRHACTVLMICAVALIAVFSVMAAGTTYYEYSYKGKTLGVVKSKKDVHTAVDLIAEKMDMAYSGEISIDAKHGLSFNKIHGTDLATDGPDDILQNLSYLHDINAYGYAILVDGTEICVLESEDAARNILRQIATSYMENGVEYSRFTYKENVETRRVATTLTEICTEAEAMEAINAATKKGAIYIVGADDTFSDIAKVTGLTTAELHALNPDIDTEKLKIGQELAIESPKPAITVVTYSNETYLEDIPYETVYTDTEGLYQGESSVRTAGVTGSRLVNADLTKENGVVVLAEEISSTVVTQPVNQEVLRGTKAIPKREGTGTFIWPTAGYVSSKFGMRWGRLHQGIDIAKSTGTPIYASDGGTVTTAGWERSYGYIVRISHGNGIVTCYAHCSKLLVKEGDKVYQGMKIALMGSTGNSTGPHCHFEVRVNGTPKDPLNYLP